MRKTAMKRILCCVLALTVCFGFFVQSGFAKGAGSSSSLGGVNLSASAAVALSEDPILTVACISDLHTDYGLQNKAPYIRNSIITTLNNISKNENADILLVGGDNTSDNGNTSDKGGWTYQTYRNVIDTYKQLAGKTTNSGYSLWAAGNHEFQAGEDEGYDSYAGFVELMLEANGDPISILRQKDDPSLAGMQYQDYVLGMHYELKGFDFIVMNAPYAQSQKYSNGTYNWLRDRLNAIGSDKTVFLVTHFPLTDSRNISTPSYGTSGSDYNTLTGILKNYPNLVFLYGHNHGGADSVFITSDTFERITSYDAKGQPVNDRNVVPTSFITAFMGSMSYYKNTYNPDWLGAPDPEIVQALMIYVYSDRIVFQMKNYGKVMGSETPLSWTVMRNVDGSPLPPEPLPEIDPSLSAQYLQTTEITDLVKYNNSYSIGRVEFNGTAALSSDGFKLEAESFPEGTTLSAKHVSAGLEYMTFKKGNISKVVKDFEAYLLTVRQSNNAIVPVETPVKVTMDVLTDELGDKTPNLDLVVYYEDANGQLCMTDIQRNEDGRTLSFVLPRLSIFALSVRANVVDDGPPILDTDDGSGSGGSNGDNVDGNGGSGGNADVGNDADNAAGDSSALILAIVGGALVAVGIGLVLFVVLSVRKKKAAQTKE